MAHNLKHFYNASKVISRLQAVYDSIPDVDTEESELVSAYIPKWFDSFFDGQCTVQDFIDEINGLSNQQLSAKLIEFIQKEVQLLQDAEKQPVSSNSSEKQEQPTSNKASSIHDRIKKKDANDSTRTVATVNTPTKKIVKVQEKDSSKQQQAVREQTAENDEDANLLSGLEGGSKKKQRCRFYPACKNEKTCPFVHPTEPCTFFPTCKFGGQCLNKHPECKFAKNCSRMDCFYEHPFPKKANMNPLMQMLQMMNGGAKRKMLSGVKQQPPFVKKVHTNSEKSGEEAATDANNTEDNHVE